MSGCFHDQFSKNISQKVIDKTTEHPCYSESACKYARMHIPVAPACNISCNYCNRKYDCLHETRPGVTSEILTPKEALDKYLLVKERVDNLKVIGVAGPGDALANFAKTKESIELIKEVDPEVTFCISTNGLMLPRYADEIVNLGVSHVTITINAIDPQIGALIYKSINFQGETLTGEEGAKALLNNQLQGLKYLAYHGVLCKVNIVTIKGVNDNHIKEVVKEVKELGAFMTNIMPLIPAEGSQFEDMPLVSNSELNALRKKCEIDLKQMYHCQQCRADAIGLLDQDRSVEFRSESSTADNHDSKKGKFKEESQEGILFAVASKTGRLIDQHFGHAEEFLIYEYSQSGVRQVDKREVKQYCAGKECTDKEDKMEQIIELLDDCEAVLSVRIGYAPRKRLQNRGVQSVEVYDIIEDGVEHAVKKLVLQETG